MPPSHRAVATVGNEERLGGPGDSSGTEGKTDMLACMKAYREIGYDGVCRPDHVPTMEGDSNDRPAYSSIGRLFAIGYIKGLREAVYAS